MVDSLSLKSRDLPGALKVLKNTVNADGTKGRPACIWGPPGIGKSQIAQQFAKDEECKFLDWRAILFDPCDLRGFPYIEDVGGIKMARWAPPDFLPAEEKIIILMEELNRAPTLVMNAFLQLVYDRQLGDYKLPEDTYIIALCNDVDAGISQMPEALKGRFIHINLNPDFEDWQKWAVTHDVHPLTIAYLRSRPECFIPTPDKKMKANPNPRSWEFASQITHQQPSSEIALNLFAGALGHGAAVEYHAFVKLAHQLPSIPELIKDPMGTKIPKDPSQLYAIGSALGRYATVENFEAILKYLDRIPQVEFNVMSVKDATLRDQTLQKTRCFKEWAMKHKEVCGVD